MWLSVCKSAVLVFVQIILKFSGVDVASIGKSCLQSNETEYRIQHTTKYDEGSKCNRDWGPETPANVDLNFRCDENKVVLTWTAKNRCCRRSLGGYLLHIHVDMVGARYGTENVLITLPRSSSKVPEQFTYKCLYIPPSASKLSVTVWALNQNMEKCGKSFTSLTLQTAFSKCAAERCVCPTEVNIQSIVGPDQASVIGNINIVGISAGTRIHVQLINEKDEVQQTWDQTWTEGQTSFRVRAENLTEGTYSFKMHRLCEQFEGASNLFSCGRYSPSIVVSNPVTLNWTHLYDTVTPYRNQDYTSPDDTPLVLVLGCALGFFLLIIAITAAVIRYHHGLRVWRPMKKFIDAQQIYQQIKGEAEAKKIAIIFAKDNQRHKRNVRNLQIELCKHGTCTVVIDESTNLNMRSNWIDEGENIPTRFDIILFVLTPLLYELCHRSTTTDLTSSATHRLPAAVLHALQVKPYYGRGQRPKAFVVSLDRSPRESNGLMKKFLNEYKTVFHPKPIFMKDMSKGIKQLLKKIYRNRPVMV